MSLKFSFNRSRRVVSSDATHEAAVGPMSRLFFIRLNASILRQIGSLGLARTRPQYLVGQLSATTPNGLFTWKVLALKRADGFCQ